MIKLAPIIKKLNIEVIHTGQHYSPELDSEICEDLGLTITRRMPQMGSDVQKMAELLNIALKELNTQEVIVQGDTNSALAGAIAAKRLGLSLIHVEAGLRSFDISMPEEFNRVIIDHMSDELFCPTVQSRMNLSDEGIDGMKCHVVGNTVIDALLNYLPQLDTPKKSNYVLMTIHRPFNVPQIDKILSQADQLGEKIVFPCHPRTWAEIDKTNTSFKNVEFYPPVSYKEFLVLERDAKYIISDSGGVQEEASFFGVPVFVMRPNTERQESVVTGESVLCNVDNLVEKIKNYKKSTEKANYGDGKAAERIVRILAEER